MTSPRPTPEIPCLHRLHKDLPLEGAKSIQVKLGMSISIDRLRAQLDRCYVNLDAESDNKTLITFDDGHKDLLEIRDLFSDYEDLQPVAFLTGKQLRGNNQPLPLTALYHYCAQTKTPLNSLEDVFGFTRASLKQIPEAQQRMILKDNGIDPYPESEFGLNETDINKLILSGWKIGYHGPDHSDLRNFNPTDLYELMAEDSKLLAATGFEKWLAWPEGFWNDATAHAAIDAGFSKQFGLINEPNHGTIDGVLNRRIWK